MEPLDKKHIVSAYDQDLKKIVLQLNQMVESSAGQLQQALDNLDKQDTKIAKDIIDRDKDINRIQVEIQDVCILIINKRQPKASDLRLVIAVFTTVFEIERIADVARKLSLLPQLKIGSEYKAAFQLINQAGRIALALFDKAMEAFLRMDLSEAMRLYPKNKPLKDNVDMAIAEVVKLIDHQKTDTTTAINVINVIRSVGKINSRCQNICELIVYYQLGENVKHRRNKEILSLIQEQKIDADEE